MDTEVQKNNDGKEAAGVVIATTTTGAGIGAMVGGPIGAAVGGMVGAITGGTAVIIKETKKK